VIEDESPLVKAQLIKSLEACAHREHESTSAAAESAYQLAMCYVNGFGVQKDLNRAWEWMMKSARLQNPNAQAQAYRLYKIPFPDQDLPLETRKEMLEWLQEAVRRGSYEAAEDLQGLDSSLYGMAKHSWEKRFCQIDIDDAPNLTSREYLAILCKKLGAPALEKMVVNERGSRPIHLAASFGNIDLLGELLKQGIDVNSLNARDETALLCACRANEPKAALFLLNFDASIIPAASGESPLHWLIALEGPSLREVAMKLIEAGANLEQQYNTTENNELTFDVYPHGTPLDWGVSKRCLAAIGLLIELGADPFNECSQYSAFTRAASAHDWEVIQILLTSKHAISSKLGALESTGQSILFEAVHCYRPYGRILIHGHDIIQAAIRTFKALLEAGCDPSRVDKDGSSIMHVLPLFFNSDFVKMLLEECQFKKYINARAGESGRTPIYHAIAAGNIEVVKLLIEHGADTYSRALGQTILHLLATIEDEDYSVLCLKALNPSSRTDLDILAESEDAPEGLTAFELAVLRSHFEFADLLLHAGADPTAVKNRDWHFLARLITLPTWDSLQALQYYLDEVECPFIVRKSTSHSVLHVAASMMHYLADNITGEQKFDVLLNMFSRVDQLDAVTTSSDEPEVAPRQTPLHYAAKFGVFYAARKLLLAGANPSIKDDDGHTPLDLARMQLTSLRARIMEHETFRAVTDLQSTVSLLERAQDLKTIRAMESDRTDTQIRTRFSRLGFQTQPPGLG
jgi:ankyrin repeat protein